MDFMEIGEGVLAGIGGLALLRGMYRAAKSQKKKASQLQIFPNSHNFQD